MHHTKLSHRILAVLLSVMLCVSMLPVTALAADADTGAENDAGIVDTEETAAEAPAEEAPVTEEEPAVEEAPAEESPAAEVMEEATELDPGVPEAETLAEDGTEAITGTCGTNLTWTLADGTLTISGTGAMENFGERNTPWYSKRTTISTVVIESGVTNITDWLFGNCTALTGISIPESVMSIDDAAFDGCDALTDVYYGGSAAQWNKISIDAYNESLTKASIKCAIVAAVIGTVQYDTLSAATDAARPGDTITLQADITDERFVVVEAGITLDLNGHKLTGAKLLYVTGSLVDHGSSKGAFSAGAYYMNYGEHTQFPVYNSAAGTYSLYEIGFYASATKAPKYRFGLDRTGDGTDAVAATALMKSDTNRGRVVAMVTVSWTQGEGSTAVDVSKTFTFTLDYMSEYLLSPFTKSFAITLSGMSSVSGVTAQPVFVVLDANGSVMYTYAGPVWNIG